MYSGTTFHHQSGNILGVHQKISRAAQKLVIQSGEVDFFPTAKSILHFEGKNGPDGIKSKTPGVDEPWHFIDPNDPEDTQLLLHITQHRHNLQVALRDKNEERAAFEAAWLSHAIADGLTPAHHFPLERKLESMRGESLETRTTYKAKLVLPGKTKREKIRNNWEFWGAKGLMTSHLLFELGVAGAVTPLRMSDHQVSAEDVKKVREHGFEALFHERMHTIYDLGMYDEFRKKGWTSKLARQTRSTLVPLIIDTVALAWIEASPEG